MQLTKAHRRVTTTTINTRYTFEFAIHGVLVLPQTESYAYEVILTGLCMQLVWVLDTLRDWRKK